MVMIYVKRVGVGMSRKRVSEIKTLGPLYITS